MISDIDEEIKKIFCEVIGLKESDVTDETSYNAIDEWDSLKHLELVAKYEDFYDFEFDMDDIIAMENFAKVKSTVNKYVGKK